LVKVLRAELLLAFAAAVACEIAAAPPTPDAEEIFGVTEVVFAAAAVTVPAGAFDTAVPAGVAPEMAT
jgi:hypothetical protein